MSDNWYASLDAWKTRAPEDERGYWDDKEPDGDEVDAHTQECGCVEYSDGDKDYCEQHERMTEDGEPRNHRAKVLCSYPGCKRLTTYDPTYGDLCSSHIRAENE